MASTICGSDGRILSSRIRRQAQVRGPRGTAATNTTNGSDPAASAAAASRLVDAATAAPQNTGKRSVAARRRSPRSLQLAVRRHLHVVGVEAQLHVLRLPIVLPSGNAMPDGILGAGALARTAPSRTRTCARTPSSP